MKLRTINFRIYEELKTQFEAACIANRTTMSAKLNHMIQDFVDAESQRKFEFSTAFYGSDYNDVI